jgi:hypothetical protein
MISGIHSYRYVAPAAYDGAPVNMPKHGAMVAAGSGSGVLWDQARETQEQDCTGDGCAALHSFTPMT